MAAVPYRRINIGQESPGFRIMLYFRPLEPAIRIHHRRTAIGERVFATGM